MLYGCSKGLFETAKTATDYNINRGKGVVNEGEGFNVPVLQKMALNGRRVNTFDTFCPKYKTTHNKKPGYNINLFLSSLGFNYANEIDALLTEF